MSDAPREEIHEGGCFCGAIRYRVAGDPLVVCHCHCEWCRRSVGAAFVTWAEFRAAGFALVQGEPRRHVAPNGVHRSFCGACGTSLFYRGPWQERTIDVTAASLDDPDRVEPSDQLWTERELRWTSAAPSLPAHARNAPAEARPEEAAAADRPDDLPT